MKLDTKSYEMMRKKNDVVLALIDRLPNFIIEEGHVKPKKLVAKPFESAVITYCHTNKPQGELDQIDTDLWIWKNDVFYELRTIKAYSIAVVQHNKGLIVIPDWALANAKYNISCMHNRERTIGENTMPLQYILAYKMSPEINMESEIKDKDTMTISLDKIIDYEIIDSLKSV